MIPSRDIRSVVDRPAASVTLLPRRRADYAVLRSGLRLHITGYETRGDRVRLTLGGGIVEVASSDLVAVEPRTSSRSCRRSRRSRSRARTLWRIDSRRRPKHGLDEKLILRVIEVESNFNPRAVSRKQALGLMQLLPRNCRAVLRSPTRSIRPRTSKPAHDI